MTANNFNRFNELADFVYKQSGIILKPENSYSLRAIERAEAKRAGRAIRPERRGGRAARRR